MHEIKCLRHLPAGIRKHDLASLWQIAIGLQYLMQHIGRCSAATKADLYVAVWQCVWIHVSHLTTGSSR